MKPNILCVDDEKDNVEALERLFRKKYNVLKATSALEALALLQTNQDIGVILTDQRMPGMSGVELLSKTVVSHPDTVRLLLTGYTDIESVISAINSGQIYRYLTKPWDPVDLALTIDQAFERYNLGLELKKKNQELSAALSELQTLDSAKSNFMILINHELKTPLTSVLNFASLLSESKLDDEQSLYNQRIISSAQRLKELIEDVLLIMKSETQQMKLDFQPLIWTSTEGIINSAIQKLLQIKNLTIDAQLENLEFKSDRRLFYQIIQRLVHNACKFCYPETQILVSSTLSGKKIRFTVRNKGPQISDSVIEKIFKPFYIDEDVMNHSNGFGLGLTVCESILKLHNSKLCIDNESDGVSIHFELDQFLAD